MKQGRHRRGNERGSLLLVVVFIATSIAGLAAIISGRVVSETRHQRVMEQETQAFNGAYSQIHLALNIVNTSPYDDQNHNLILQEAIQGTYGGTIEPTGVTVLNKDSLYTFDENGNPVRYNYDVAGVTSGYTRDETQATSTAEKDDLQNDLLDWLDQPEDPDYGLLPGTNVRVYRGRDYIQRLQRLRGIPIAEVDPFGDSSSYFVLEAAGRAGNVVRLVSALVRENQPFSSYVFFQNRSTLGISGKPRGLIHTNEKLAFYFPGGRYIDGVSAVEGFEFLAGATPENTYLHDANPEATRIDIEKVDFTELADKSTLYRGEPGLDAEIQFFSNGKVRIRPHTPPQYVQVEKSYTYQQYSGTQEVTVTEQQQVQVGEQEVTYTEEVIDHYETETYFENVRVQVGETTETRYRTEKVQVGTQTVVKTKQEPVYATRTVTKYKKVKVWVAFDGSDAGGGTTVGGGGNGQLGEWVWEDVPYETTETYIDHYETVEYTVEEPIYENQQVAYTVTTPIYETQKVERTREVPVYTTVTKTRMEPIYEMQDVQVTKTEPVYEDVTVTYTSYEYQQPVYFDNQFYEVLEGDSAMIYVDGRITQLDGRLQGRVTVVGNEMVRITGNVQYVDSSGQTAMGHGEDPNEPYARNTKYTGSAVLGVIAREDVVYTQTMPSNGEINGTLMSVNGRVGVDGFWADETGDLVKDSSSVRRGLLTYEERLKEAAYDRHGNYRTRYYLKNSLRRIGGAISNNRIMETYVTTDKNGYATVNAGYKRGDMRFDVNLLFNPPPNFVEVPRPVVAAFVPVFLVRNNDS